MKEQHLISSITLSKVLKSEKNNNGAIFTVKSCKTGKDYTYKISRSSYNGKWYTHINVETEYLKFKRLGTYFNGVITNKKSVIDSPSAVAIAFVLDKVEKEQFVYLDKNIELMHSGHCLSCGKTLTDSMSIEIGLGPTCRNK